MRSTFRMTIAALVLSGSVVASAQDTAQGEPVPAAPAAKNQPEEIVITGSRIKRTDLVANSPVSMIDSDQLKFEQGINVEDVIKELPQALPGITAGVNNGNPGVATVNLRNLDDERTLVLVNGRRFVGYDQEGIVDLNNIPSTLIERIDVVTGGASAIYGSDAIAGVVNFVLKDDFEGVQLNFDYNNALRGGEATKAVGVTMGGNFAEERGNATVYVGWTDRDAISQGDRAFSKTSLIAPFNQGGAFGSSADTEGNVICSPRCIVGPANFGLVHFQPDGSVIGDTGRRFNFNPFNYLQVPESRYQASGLVHYDINEWVTAYGEVHFAQTQVVTQLAPSPTIGTSFEIPFDSIFLSSQSQRALFDRVTGPGLDDANGFDLVYDTNGDGEVNGNDEVSVDLRRRYIEVGPRITRNSTQAYQVVGGLRGDIPFLDEWSYDLSFQHGRTELSRVFENDVSGPKIQNVLDASSPTTNPGATAEGSCHSDAAIGCVVANLFGDGNLSATGAEFLRLNLNEDVYTTQDVAALSFSGNLGETFKVPGASAIGLVLGGEWRRQKSANFPDSCYRVEGCSPGFSSTKATVGKYNVKEFYFETLVPLLEERPFVETLNFEAAYRYADYSTAGGVSAWKVGGEWAPGEFVDGLRLRVNYQEAVRAPNVFELFQPESEELDNSAGDPCAGFAERAGGGGIPLPVSQAVRDICVNQTNVPAGLFTPDAGNPGFFITAVPDVVSGQINAQAGGNPLLGEETSHTLTIGGVYQPTFIEGLTITIDWYRVDIDDAIDSINADTVLTACYTPSINTLCNLVDRIPLSGTSNGGLSADGTGIIETEQNIATLKVSGVDFSIDYLLDLGNLGNINFGLDGTKVIQYDFKTDPISPINKCLGEYGNICDPPNPSVRFTQRSTWYMGDFNVGYRWRFIDKVEEDTAGSLPSEFASNSSAHYVDFVVGWAPSGVEWLQGFEFQVGLENAFDEDPPVVGNFAGTTTYNSGNTYPGTYDVIGRLLTLSLEKRF